MAAQVAFAVPQHAAIKLPCTRSSGALIFGLMSRWVRHSMRIGSMLVAMLFILNSKAQATPTTPSPPTTAVKAPGGTEGTKVLDTGETLTFLGKKLWFEAKRRLDLTSEEEERKQRLYERSVRLRVGSVRLQQGRAKEPKAN
jgi:hypothetical protein